MAKSPLARGSSKGKYVRNNKNIVPLHLTIPYKSTNQKAVTEFDISHLLHLGANKSNQKIKQRTPYLRSFCKQAKQYFNNNNSAKSVSSIYDSLRSFIAFCDAVKVPPFSEEGYLKYAGNDGELRHRIKMYNPSIKLWERQHGDEIGIKESSVTNKLSNLRKALIWCGLPAKIWITLHRNFANSEYPIRGYCDAEEKLLVTRLSELFFTIATQLIIAKKENLTLPDELPVAISLGEHQEVIYIQTSLAPQGYGCSKSEIVVNASSAFNMAMGAAYYLMCFFTSLNDSNIRDIAHPIKIHIDERNKSLQMVKVSSYKARSNIKVDAVLTNESHEKFDVDKRDGVKFIKTLEELSKLYGSGKKGSKLLFTLNNKREENDSFNLKVMNKHLTAELNLVSPYRASTLPWFKELFYAYRNEQVIKLKTETNELGRVFVSKEVRPCARSKGTQGATNTAYCILSCYTNLPLQGVLLPLLYSEKDSDGNISVSFKYRNGISSFFTIPAADKALIQDIEQHSTELADKQLKKHERLLIKKGHENQPPKDWRGISPISSNQMRTWSVGPNDYFISLQSSRWREMTSNQVYSDNGKDGVQAILQNQLETIDKHYANGDFRLNKIIISQAIQVVEQQGEGMSLKQAKDIVAVKLGIPMLTHDEWQKIKEEESAKTNPNGLNCNGQQSINGGKNTQRETNNSMGLLLPCAEYDMCHKCQSAKAIDDVQSIYKLISFIGVLKEALDQYPDAKDEVHEKITAFEFTLDGASHDVYEGAMALFNRNGPHPRVSTDHAILSLYR